MLKYITIVIFSTSLIFPQNLKDIGAGVIDFLLRNPTTANKFNSTQSVALDIIGDLLLKDSERKFQLDYADASSNQITINTNDGRQAQFVKTENGKIFILMDGVIYPISQELIYQAQGQNVSNYSNFQTGINMTEVEKWINYEDVPTILYKEYYSVGARRGRYLSQISAETGVPDSLIGDENYYQLKSKYLNNSKRIPYGTKLTLQKVKFDNSIGPLVPFKWRKDFNGDGEIGLNEFRHKKSTFYDNENFYIGVLYRTNDIYRGKLTIDIFNDYTGELVYSRTEKIKINNKTNITSFPISTNELLVGPYTVNAKTTGYNTTYASNSMDIEIVRGDKTTREMSYGEKYIRENSITLNTPKGIFFYSGYTDKNHNNKWDFNEFRFLNKKAYSLTSDTLSVGLNFPNMFGEAIIQSFTKDGKLIGTTTTTNHLESVHSIYPNSNPYESMDYIDMVQISGAGEYTIKVSFIDGITVEKELIIID